VLASRDLQLTPRPREYLASASQQGPPASSFITGEYQACKETKHTSNKQQATSNKQIELGDIGGPIHLNNKHASKEISG